MSLLELTNCRTTLSLSWRLPFVFINSQLLRNSLKLAMRKAGCAHSKCKLAIKRDDEGCLAITATDDAKILSGMRFDPKKLEVTWREFNSVNCIKTVPKATAIAYVDGVSWTKTVTEPKDAMSSFYVSVGRFVESEHGFLNVIITDVIESKVRLQIDLTLRWPLS